MSGDAFRPGAAQAPPEFGRGMLDRWLLDPDVVHLNHGTVGATPRCVLDEQQALRNQIERNPAQFMIRELTGSLLEPHRKAVPRLRSAASDVAAFVSAPADDLVFVDNTTTAINAILRSFDFRPRDEILILDHGYGAIRKLAEYVARLAAARVVSVSFPFPNTTPDAVVSALTAAITPRTRIAILDHITSPSALLLPLEQMTEVCHKAGVAVLVDGAHVPGAVALDISALGVDWYTGNLHKWCWAPRSCALLYVDSRRQAGLHATTISWGFDQGLTAEFDWVGTRDPTPYLAAPAAIAWMTELGIARVRQHNHALAWQAGQTLAHAFGTVLPAPESMVGTMVSVRLPERAGSTQDDADRLRAALLFEERIEVHMHALSGAVWVRVSAQIYNEPADIERLAQALRTRV